MNSALIIVDMQNDFLEGSMKINNSEKIIPRINKLIVKSKENNWLVINTMDCHPNNHISFKQNGGKWPSHCVDNTIGCEISKKIIVDDYIIKKGTKMDSDSYSGFYNGKNKYPTNLDDILKSNDVKNVYICGLALDYCVLETAIDAKKKKYNTFVIVDLSVPISQDILEVYNLYYKNKIKLIRSNEIGL